MYVKPVMIIINFADDESLVAMARCSQNYGSVETCMDLKKIYKTVSHIRYEVKSDLGKRIFIIPNNTGIPDMKNVLCLSDTSLQIWEMIKDGHSAEQIIVRLSEQYGEEIDKITTDVTSFLCDILSKEYINELE